MTVDSLDTLEAADDPRTAPWIDLDLVVQEGTDIWWCETHRQSGKEPGRSCVWALAFGGKAKQRACVMVHRRLITWEEPNA